MDFRFFGFFRLDDTGRCRLETTELQSWVLAILILFGLFVLNTTAVVSFVIPLKKSLECVYDDDSKKSDPVNFNVVKFDIFFNFFRLVEKVSHF